MPKCAQFQEYATAYSNTYNVDDCLLRLLGNLALRGIVLSQVELALVEAAIEQLAEVREALKGLGDCEVLLEAAKE